MDPGERLRQARSIKEEGNDYFKRGKLPEAQKSYTKVLDMLREEITFTGDDQKKKRESLILAAHLNLAECSLRLGNYVSVIDFCSTALSMDSNNVKAHFRRAKAFENLSEYAKALEGYQTVLRLEPNNSAAQKQQSECKKKINEKDDQQLSKRTKQEPDELEDNGMEIINEYFEDALNSRYRDCKKNPGHKAFINVKDFQINHLPPRYQDQNLFEHLKNQIRVTVLLKVKGNSEHRPEFVPGSRDRYPASGKKYRRLIRYGSGWVCGLDLKEGQEVCPCTTCQSSGMPIKQWAQIWVKTARHVVYDDIEGSKTVCYFFYDREKDDLQSCPSLCNSVNVQSLPEIEDESVLLFISHNKNFVKELHKICGDYASSHMKVKQKFSTNSSCAESKDMLDKFIQLHHRLSELSTELRQQLDTVKAISNREPLTDYLKHLAKQNGQDKNDVQRLSNLGHDELGADDCEVFIKTILNQFELSCRCHTSVGNIVESYQDLVKNEGGKQHLEKCYPELASLAKVLEKTVIQYRWLILHWDRNLNNTTPPVVEDYNEVHPLTVIISHPHGCSKKISVGEVIDSTSKNSRLYRQFTYSAATCPGSSGAPVFILGDIAGVSARPHSGFGTSDSIVGGQWSESAMSLNL